MAGGKRSLEFDLLSDVSKFDLAAPADDLEAVGKAAAGMATDAGKAEAELKRLAAQGKDAQRELDRLNAATRENKLDRLGTDAKDTARKVDTAFDTIARSSKQSARAVDTSTSKVKSDLKEVKQEAGSTAREAAASFSGSGDIGDALQELAANAPFVLGPIGAAFGIVAAAGVGLFRAKTEALKEQVSTIVDAIIEGGGRVDDAFVNVKLADLAKDGELAKVEALVEQYQIAGITYRDVARAKAGDAAASAKVVKALDAESKRRKLTDADLTRSEAAVAALTNTIGAEQDAMRLAQAAAADYAEATIDSTTTAAQHVDTATKAWDDLKATYGEDIIGRVRLDDSDALRQAQIAWGNADRYFRDHPITIRTAPGKRPVRDVP